MTQIWEKDRYLTLTKHNRPCGSTSREPLVTDQLSRSFKPFSNQHDSVKEDREKGKKNMFRSENPHESLVSLCTYPFLPSNPGIQPKSFSKKRFPLEWTCSLLNTQQKGKKQGNKSVRKGEDSLRSMTVLFGPSGEHTSQGGRGLAKQQLCTCITLFCTFICCSCTTTTWNDQILSFLRTRTGNR